MSMSCVTNNAHRINKLTPKGDYMINDILSINDEALLEAVFEAYTALFEVAQLPTMTEVKEGEKPFLNGYKLISDNGRKLVYRVWSRGADGKAYRLNVAGTKVPPAFSQQFGSDNMVSLSFIKEGANDFGATGTGSVTAFNSAFGMMRKITDMMGADAISYIPSGGDEKENSDKARLYTAYFSKFFKEFKQVPKELLPPQQADMGMDIRVKP